MIWNPWWKLKLMRERAESAERQVVDLRYAASLSRHNELIKVRELRYVNDALRRRNILVMILRVQLRIKNNDNKTSEKQADVN